MKNGNVLCIGDTHIPFTHPDYLSFCKRVYKDYNCSTVIHMGDAIDNHAVSYHEHDPDGLSPGDECKAVVKEIQKWYKAFPNVLVTTGSHDLLPYRKAKTHGIPKKFMKDLDAIWNSPAGWIWDTSFVIDNVVYVHGTGTSGKFAHINRAVANRQSTVIGHIHTSAGVGYVASKNDIIFGMNVGCGINIPKYAFAYQKDFPARPILGCGVVSERGRMANFIPMEL